MPPTSAQDPQERVSERFRCADLNHPVTAMLYELALAKEHEQSSLYEFGAGIRRMEFPDSAAFERQGKESLLPLETIRDRIKLPTVPGTVFRLMEALERQASSEDLADIIRPDPKLTTAVLSLVNSPMYALPFQVETLSRAITVIGTREISALALGTRIMAMFEDTTPEHFPMDAFWKHSIACAALANDIALMCGKPEPERYLVAGLLHDMGRVMLCTHAPERCAAALALSQKRTMGLHEAELSLFDVDHAMIGAIFFKEWGLPRSIVQSCLHHHNPAVCLGKELPEVIFVANQIASALGLGCNPYYSMDDPGEAIWISIGLDKKELAALLDSVEDRLWALFCSLFPQSGECRLR
ncbi:MAG: HDOD domain-containing protein [Desulfovibrionaceae bacterium]